MPSLRLLVAGLACAANVVTATQVVHTTLTPGETSTVRRSLSREQSSLLDAVAASLAEDPSIDMWRPAWSSLCESLANPQIRGLVARYVVDAALQLTGEAVASASKRVEDTKDLQEAVRKEQGRVVNAADRLVNEPEGDLFHRTPAFIPNRALVRVAPSAGAGQLSRMDDLQDYMTELADAADSLVDILSAAERSADLAQRNHDALTRRLPEISRTLATCASNDGQRDAAGR